MAWFKWLITPDKPIQIDNDLCHNLRNALAGIQYERKQIAKSLVTIAAHMERIEAAIKPNGGTNNG